MWRASLLRDGTCRCAGNTLLLNDATCGLDELLPPVRTRHMRHIVLALPPSLASRHRGVRSSRKCCARALRAAVRNPTTCDRPYHDRSNFGCHNIASHGPRRIRHRDARRSAAPCRAPHSATRDLCPLQAPTATELITATLPEFDQAASGGGAPLDAVCRRVVETQRGLRRAGRDPSRLSGHHKRPRTRRLRGRPSTGQLVPDSG